MSIANAIKEVRITCYLSQQEFADALGVSFATVNRWENEKTIPNLKAMKNIEVFCSTRGLNVNLTELYLTTER